MVAAFTMNYVEEAIGIVAAAKAAAMPVAISFTLETDGHLPSGERSTQAIRRTDEETGRLCGLLHDQLRASDAFRHVLEHGGPGCSVSAGYAPMHPGAVTPN